MNQRFHLPLIPRGLFRYTAALLVCLVVAERPSWSDEVRILDSNDASLAARLRLAAEAHRTLDAAYFLVTDDDSSYLLLARLRDAARRGVRVRLIMDAYRSSASAAVLQLLMEEGVEVRQYHPLRWDMLSRYTRRMHDKLMIRDGEAMIVGGRNIGDEYFGKSSGDNFRDRDAYVTGAVARHAGVYFERLWNSDSAVPFPRSRGGAGLPGGPSSRRPGAVGQASLAMRRGCPRCRARRRLDAARRDAVAYDRIIPGAPMRFAALAVRPQEVQFLHGNPDEVEAGVDITQHLLELIGSARREVLIETPYLVLSARFQQAFESAIRRGAVVRIVTNSLASTNHVVTYAGLANQKSELAQMGIEIWEYQGSGHLHAKSMVIDDVAVIGSYNLNPRSEYYDTEVAVIARDHRLADQLRSSIRRSLADSVQGETPHIAGTGRPAPRPISAGRHTAMQILRIVAPLIRRHL